METSGLRDIRGINCTEKHATNKSFQKLQAGHKPLIKFLVASFGIIAGILNFIPLFSGAIFYIFSFPDNVNYIDLFLEIIVYTTSLIILVFRGYQLISIYFIVALILIGVALSISPYSDTGWTILAFGISIILAWVGAAITALSMALTSACCGMIGQFLAILGSGVTAVVLPVIVKTTQPQTKPLEVIITSITAIAVIFTGAIIARRALEGAPQFAWIKDKAIFLAATGGTSFYGVDLTDACFDGADLRHTDFRKANLTRTSFKDVTGLELARLQGTILEQPNVRKLLTTSNGCGEDFTDADLCGANLRGANLREATLIRAQLVDADLSEAILTDACIQDWNINHNTRFQDVDCQRVYLRCNKNGHFFEPKPDSGEFQPGEFEKWITDVRDTIDLIFQNGLNWRAFAFSLTQTSINNEGLGLSVRSIENKGDGVVVAKVGVSVETDKTAIHEEIKNYYNDAVKAIEAKYELALKAKDGEIERLERFYESQQQFIQGFVTGIAETTGKVQIQGEGNRIYVMNKAGDIMESNNQNIKAGGNIDMSSGAKVNAGRDISGASLTLGDYNTQVGNTIQQLKDISTDNTDQLAEILAALQKAITSDTAISESQKKDALEAVETIAEEGKKSPEERVLKLCSMALNALKGITATVSDASKLAEVFTTHLPTLTNLLGI